MEAAKPVDRCESATGESASWRPASRRVGNSATGESATGVPATSKSATSKSATSVSASRRPACLKSATGESRLNILISFQTSTRQQSGDQYGSSCHLRDAQKRISVYRLLAPGFCLVSTVIFFSQFFLLIFFHQVFSRDGATLSMSLCRSVCRYVCRLAVFLFESFSDYLSERRRCEYSFVLVQLVISL